MHLAKGLEFRAVAVMACDEVIRQERMKPSRMTRTLRRSTIPSRHLMLRDTRP